MLAVVPVRSCTPLSLLFAASGTDDANANRQSSLMWFHNCSTHRGMIEDLKNVSDGVSWVHWHQRRTIYQLHVNRPHLGGLHVAQVKQGGSFWNQRCWPPILADTVPQLQHSPWDDWRPWECVWRCFMGPLASKKDHLPAPCQQTTPWGVARSSTMTWQYTLT